MNPRTFTIVAVVLAVIGVASYAAGWVLRSRVDDALGRVQIVKQQRDSLIDLDEAHKTQVAAELNEAMIDSARAKVWSRIGVGAFVLAVLANAIRRRLAHRASASSHGGLGQSTPVSTT